ncbi:hypothetical protein M3Y99_01919800 [Aphelenchoides fujianensis]|nr:hypothetical protein M3Y99_01919800 [Aphelenchoides fujianensis]
MWSALLFSLLSVASVCGQFAAFDFPFYAPSEVDHVAFNVSLGNPRQPQRILLLDDPKLDRNLTVVDVKAGGSFDPSASAAYKQLGFTFDQSGEANGQLAQDIIRLENPRQAVSYRTQFVVRNDSSAWAPFGALGLARSNNGDGHFFETLAYENATRVITFSLDNLEYKPREETTGVMSTGSLAPARCQSNAQFFNVSRTSLVDWLVQTDEVTFGTTTIDAPGPLHVSVGNWWFGLPLSLMQAAMRAAGVNSDLSVDCGVDVSCQFKVGSFEFVVGPADYLRPGLEGLCEWKVLPTLEIWLPASVLNGTCLHLHYEQSMLGFSSRVVN